MIRLASQQLYRLIPIYLACHFYSTWSANLTAVVPTPKTGNLDEKNSGSFEDTTALFKFSGTV